MKDLKQTKNKRSILLALSLLAGAGLVGCTKTKPFQEEAKLDVIDKKVIDTQGEYIYQASMSAGSRDAEDAFPGWFADVKRVKLKFTPEALIVEETETDRRFQANETNNKTVIEIPIEHLDYKCAKDGYGECTNKEVKDEDVEWSDKSKFKLKPEGLKAGQFELLPIQMERDLTLGFCYSEVSARVVGEPEITPEAVNFEIERTFKQNIFCNSGRNIKDTNIKARFHYSMVKADKVISRDFKPRSYPRTDEQTFGFFSTEKFPLDIDNSETQSGRVSLMNHWNPNRENIDFHLSDEFNKPEHEVLKDLSFKVVSNLNYGFEKAGVKFRITLHEPSGKKLGDIRNSMIALVEDPSAASVIGYGPQTEDPATGEIVSARSVMYLGAIQNFVKYTYDEIARSEKRRKTEESARASGTETLAQLASKDLSALKPEQRSERSLDKKEQSLSSRLAKKVNSSKEFQDLLKTYIKKPTPVLGAPIKKPETGLSLDKNKISREIERQISGRGMMKDSGLSYLMHEGHLFGLPQETLDVPGLNIAKSDEKSGAKPSADLVRKYTYLQKVKHCAFSPDVSHVGNSVRTRVVDLFKGQELKVWAQLNEAEKKKVMDVLIPEVWEATLIHEIGHNLGLRHNFNGSESKEYFYSPEEIVAINTELKDLRTKSASKVLQKVGSSEVVSQDVPLSHSVMEYIEDSEALRVLGKYDLNALRIAYTGQAEVSIEIREDETNKLVSTEVRKVDVLNSTLEAEVEKIKAEVEKSIQDKKDQVATVEPVDLGFCTDEHVGINAGCRRFDLGTSYTEIVENLAKEYETWYSIRNFRNDRSDFSLFGDISHANRIGRIFYDARLMLEIYERIQSKWNLPESVWKENKFLADIWGAAQKSGEFLLGVLETPDTFCVAKEKTTGVFVTGYLSRLAQNPNQVLLDCSQAKVSSQYEIVGQGGKSFNSLKDPESPNNYADQIDVRGYWVDKLQAARFLMTRSVGVSNLDESSFNFMDLPSVRPQILESLQAMTLGDHKAKSKIQMFDGSAGEIPMPMDYIDMQKVKKPIHPIIAGRLSVPFSEFHIMEVILRLTAHTLVGHKDWALKEKLTSEIFKVAKVDARDNSVEASDSTAVLRVSDDKYFASTNNKIALEIINELAPMIASMDLVSEFQKQDEKFQKAVVDSIMATEDSPLGILGFLNHLLARPEFQSPNELSEDLILLALRIKIVGLADLQEIATKGRDQLLLESPQLKLLNLLPLYR